MAPHIQPKSLLSLSYESVSNIIFRKCQEIDENYQFGQKEWEEETETLQQVLLNKVPGSIWDTLSDTVFTRAIGDKDNVFNDCTVLYAALISKHTKKLTIRPVHSSKSVKVFYDYFVESMTLPEQKSTRNHRNLWLKILSKLDGLESIDYWSLQCSTTTHSEAAQFSCTFIDGLLKRFKNLRSYRLIYGADSMQEILKVLQTFPKLEEIPCPWMGDALVALGQWPPLNLVSFVQAVCKPSHVNKAIVMCPHLRSMTINPESNASSEEIFSSLAKSALQLNELTVSNFFCGENMKEFLRCKGNAIRTLLVSTASGRNLELDALFIGQSCPNISTLKINNTNSLTAAKPLIKMIHEGLFTKLTMLEYVGNNIVIPKLCISNSSIISSLILRDLCGETEDTVVELLDPMSMTEITTINIVCDCSERLLCHIYMNCPKVTNIGVWYPNRYKYINEDWYRHEIKVDNLDLKVNASLDRAQVYRR